MKSFLNIKIYEEIVILDGEHTGERVIMFSDDKERDWYETRKEWSAVVMVQPETNIVCAVETDVERLSISPGMNLFEIEPSKIPDDMILGKYKFIDGEFVLIT